MAKGTGLIGNFKGKVGNTVGYKLSASNNGQTQGIRVYQPIVKNPKTAAQAEQRAKLLAVNATYRALKMVIDRGNEGLPYGNKSRLTWLKGALKSTQMPWYEKGAVVMFPVGCQLTKGSLTSLNYSVQEDSIKIFAGEVTAETTVNTIGTLSTALKGSFSFLKDGDQITLVTLNNNTSGFTAEVKSFVIDTTSSVATDDFVASAGQLSYEPAGGVSSGAVIISRQGDNGQHLRSNEVINIPSNVLKAAPYDADSKAAAIASYQASAANNSDWAEESIQ